MYSKRLGLSATAQLLLRLDILNWWRRNAHMNLATLQCYVFTTLGRYPLSPSPQPAFPLPRKPEQPRSSPVAHASPCSAPVDSDCRHVFWPGLGDVFAHLANRQHQSMSICPPGPHVGAVNTNTASTIAWCEHCQLPWVKLTSGLTGGMEIMAVIPVPR